MSMFPVRVSGNGTMAALGNAPRDRLLAEERYSALGVRSAAGYRVFGVAP